MNAPSPRRPSPLTHGLWSLWDMLDVWGYRYFHIGSALAYAEADLMRHNSVSNGLIRVNSNTIEADHPKVEALFNRCIEILRFAEGQELGSLPTRVDLLKAKIIQARKTANGRMELDDLRGEVERLKTDFNIILHERFYYSLPPTLNAFYGKPQLFGSAVFKKFPQAQFDIEKAGNCLALGEPTACILHLNRAMEIAVRRLATRLKVKLDPRDSWGDALRLMEAPIKQMPANTAAAKRKKELWAACHALLAHVKMAWRDPSSHGTRNYDDKDAADILKRTGDFLQHLTGLL